MSLKLFFKPPPLNIFPITSYKNFPSLMFQHQSLNYLSFRVSGEPPTTRNNNKTLEGGVEEDKSSSAAAVQITRVSSFSERLEEF